jgi:hypothetical protein
MAHGHVSSWVPLGATRPLRLIIRRRIGQESVYHKFRARKKKLRQMAST